ncbi:uncharacterized protein N7477_009087 [Penicillium maclennaniae]|uniref:uncharacterized protein n=1 Tax=Penicillium maclennaniae TaxID=1343394 RepID=UPI00254249B2|nr:uncharacterized protein N7477_009087 [Penicillium maclennaniae]KAJ5661471.1 hypothetical protein N7477_009087 [Penicillium maclennaniae]
MTDSPAQSGTKRKRLSYACNDCREKKTRRDEEQPCRNCRLAGVQCVTTDKRRDNAPVSHRRRHNSALARAEIAEWLDTRVHSSKRGHLRLAAPRPGHQSPVCPLLLLLLRTNSDFGANAGAKRGWRTGRLPMMPCFVGSSTVELLGEWLNMALYRLNIPKSHMAPPIINGDFASLILERSPDLPPPPERRRAIDTFRKTLYQLFPFLSHDDGDIISKEGFTAQNLLLRKASDAPGNGLTYLIITAGLLATPSSEETRTLVSSYLSCCNSLLGYTLATRSLKSVQFVLLFSIVLQSCDKLAWAWDVLSMGVSLAQSIGIYRSSASAIGDQSNRSTSEGNTW